MTILNRQTILNTTDSAVTTSPWYPLDYRIDPGGVIRSFMGSLTVGDTVYMELTNEPVVAADGTVTAPSVIVTVSAFTTTPFNGTFAGQYSAIRFRKTGTTGTVKVFGVI